MVQNVHEQMEVLHRLTVVDYELNTLNIEFSKERDALSGVQGELQKVREVLAAERLRCTALETERNKHVQEGKSLNQQLERSREKLSRVRNEKEANAAQRETEETRKLLQDVEELVGKRLIEIDELKKNILRHEEEENMHATRLGETEGAVTSKLHELETLRSQKSNERAEIIKNLNPTVLRKYELVRSKRIVGAASFENGLCKACNMNLPPQLAQRVMRMAALEQCPSCQRILFVVVKPEPINPLE